ncbi:hypothetical protein QE416_000352 [Microbacterium sp. SORGH_AS 421]|nr:hypothetical protein [Microbacterium sp. SORGH_AS_0421]
MSREAASEPATARKIGSSSVKPVSVNSMISAIAV